MGVDRFMSNSVVNETMKVQYELIRKKGSRSLSIRITDDARVVVHSPYHLSRQAVDRFVLGKSDWIDRKLHVVNALPPALPSHTWETGDRFILLDQDITLIVQRVAGERCPPAVVDSTLTIHLGLRSGRASVRMTILKWYEDFGLSLYRELVDLWCERLGIEQTIPVAMASFPKRMGSCSHTGQLRFALRSLMLPLEIVDYLALHEVTHLLHFNHGKSFKQALSSQMPDWRERQRRMQHLRIRTSRV